MLGTGPLDVPGARSLHRKIEELKGRITQPKWQRMLEELTDEIQGEFNLRRLLDKVMDTLIDLTRAQRGFLILVEGRKMVFKVRRNIDRQTLQGPLCEISESVVQRVLKSGELFNSENASEDQRLLDVPSVRALGLRSILAVPFRHRRQTIGAVYLDNRTSAGTFAEARLDVVRSFAAVASQAILVADLVTRLQQRMRQLDRLNRKLKDENRVQSVRLQRQGLYIAKSEQLQQRKYAYDNILGRGRAMQRVFAMLDHVIPQESTTLITGETGTGKELIARAIHYHGPRKDRPFVPLNCAALPETLLESELFGHVKGAFTGAVTPKVGLAQLADTGTLFLDEVGEMSPPLQAKLLRLLQEGEVRPVGDARSVRVDVRVVAATHRDLKSLSDSGAFRKDLYYRLSVICLPLPPLRERLEDLALLVDGIMARLHREKKLPMKNLDAGALDPMIRHSWPGNIRELENVLERLLTFGDRTITAEHVARALGPVPASGPAAASIPPEGLDLKGALEKLEADLLARALALSRNKSEAARLLRIDRTWFLRLLKKHRLR